MWGEFGKTSDFSLATLAYHLKNMISAEKFRCTEPVAVYNISYTKEFWTIIQDLTQPNPINLKDA